MKVSIIVFDKNISIDGHALRCDFQYPEGLRAIQWDGESGEAEWQGPLNEKIDAEFIAPYVEAWQKEKARIDAIEEERRISHEEYMARYDVKRAAEYPPFTDYLDGMVKGDQAQIDAYIAACLAVKAKYPKPVE